ncbi:hypothetical protein M0R45_026237 [Rubus argutus]|uniref:Uncharacterized protein n=1 Tax=Rubus argutus TaxID=59490 RepID=A0AAW1WZ89_RUBAR
MMPSPLHTAELNSAPSHQFKTGCNLTVHTTRAHCEPVNSSPSLAALCQCPHISHQSLHPWRLMQITAQP